MHSALSDMKEAYPEMVSGVFGKGLIGAILFKDQKNGSTASEFASRVVGLYAKRSSVGYTDVSLCLDLH